MFSRIFGLSTHDLKIGRVAEQAFVVVDGLRFPEDHAFFVERYGSKFVHLHLDAPDAVREKRYTEGIGGGLSFADADRQPVEAEIDRLSDLATKVIENVGTISNLEDAVVSFASEHCHQELPCLSPSS
jgi:hypothetical protein